MRTANIQLGAAISGLAALLAATAVDAQDRGVMFAGADGGEDASGYAGVTWAAPASRLGDGWAVRGLASAGRYDYDSGAVEIEAEFVQADISLLHQRSGAWGYLNLGLGARITDTDLDPVDPGNDRQGSHWDGIVSVDGARDMGPWRVGGYGVYGVRMREYYVRADLTRRVATSVRLGVEALVDGDESFSRTRGGAVLVYEPSSRYAVRGVIGGRDDGGAYASLGFSRAF